MRAASSAALSRVQERWEPVLRQAESEAQVRTWGEQLFGVADSLAASVSLSRALTDPARNGEARSALAHGLLTGKVDEVVADVVSGLARENWSRAEDLPAAIEQIGVDSVLSAAEHAGQLAEVEDEIYRLDRIVAGERELALALTARGRSVDDRVELMGSVLAGRTRPETEILAKRACVVPHGQALGSALRGYADAAAARRQRLVAAVTSATPLSDEQIARLTETLRRKHGREVQVHVSLDPAVVGGLRIEIGEQVVDATLSSRLAEARRRLAG